MVSAQNTIKPLTWSHSGILDFPPKNGWRSVALWSLIYLIGAGVEIVGVNTGLLFGEYSYGMNLGPKVFGVPLLIGINWVVLTFLSATLSKRLIRNKWCALICGASMMVALDFFIEPIAPIFDYWSWDAGAAPLRNYLDWFIVSFVMQVIAQKDIYSGNNPFPVHHFASQVLFFVFFYVVYQF